MLKARCCLLRACLCFHCDPVNVMQRENNHLASCIPFPQASAQNMTRPWRGMEDAHLKTQAVLARWMYAPKLPDSITVLVVYTLSICLDLKYIYIYIELRIHIDYRYIDT